MADARSLADRLWSKVEKIPFHDCWEWSGHRNRKGYGKIRLSASGGTDSAHRVVFELTRGHIPAGLQVLHCCDNPSCCNPRHLFLGDNLANVRDKVSKGRQARGWSCAQLGEAHHAAKLRAEDIVSIRHMIKSGSLQREVAESFGVRQNTISKIVNRKAWSHVS